MALRAGMEALPIREENEHGSVSKNEGVMCVCGRDACTALLVGAGCSLNDIKEQLPGRVLLGFQPVEEIAPDGGERGSPSTRSINSEARRDA